MWTPRSNVSVLNPSPELRCVVYSGRNLIGRSYLSTLKLLVVTVPPHLWSSGHVLPAPDLGPAPPSGIPDTSGSESLWLPRLTEFAVRKTSSTAEPSSATHLAFGW